MYPTAPVDVEVTSGKLEAPGARDKGKRGKPRPRKAVDDPFEVAEVEPGHRYTSWKGGQVDIKPGQVIPRGLIPKVGSTPTNRGTVHTPATENYESVLHNVLLTPTYFGVSPLPVPTPSPSPSPLGSVKREAPDAD